MNFKIPARFRLILFTIVLAVFTCAPVWAVEYFINQDGSGHVYTASLMTELLKGNRFVAEVFAFNSLTFPNSSGHWLLVFLLLFVSPLTATKIMMTLTYLGIAAGAGWLRWRTNGRDGVETAMLVGAAAGFNWLWLLGFYNFNIGVIGFAFTVGLYFVWRENMNWRRCLVLSALLVLVYLSHIISFGILAGSVFLLSVFVPFEKLKKTLLWTLPAFLPVVPMLIIYRSLSESGGGDFAPVWRYLSDPFSPLSWLNQFRGADLFVLISRKTLPFTDLNSNLLAVFAPGVWLVAAVVCLSLATWIYLRRGGGGDGGRDSLKKQIPFALIFALFIFIVMFAPDDFSWQHGGIMRERFLLCSLLIFVPLFRLDGSVWLKRAAHFLLAAIIVFQTLALWEYSLAADKTAREFLSAGRAVPEKTKIASVVIVEDGVRFHLTPAGQLNNYLGIGRDVLVWDNYELGHYLFPVVARNSADRRFVFDLTRNNVFPLNDPTVNLEEKLANLDAILAEHHEKIETLLVWGSESRVEAVVKKYFAEEPFFQNGRVRLLRRASE
jgi:hypothetical protein